MYYSSTVLSKECYMSTGLSCEKGVQAMYSKSVRQYDTKFPYITTMNGLWIQVDLTKRIGNGRKMHSIQNKNPNWLTLKHWKCCLCIEEFQNVEFSKVLTTYAVKLENGLNM